jgi:hypothetical protein
MKQIGSDGKLLPFLGNDWALLKLKRKAITPKEGSAAFGRLPMFYSTLLDHGVVGAAQITQLGKVGWALFEERVRKSPMSHLECTDRD